MTLTTVNPALLDTQAQYTGFKNRIINGAMVIDQRNAGASVTPANGATTFITDRWAIAPNQSSKLTAQQSTVVPSGFTNSLLVTSSSAYAIGSSDYFILSQKVEGFNCADFAWGTASAQAVTISFKVRSSLTGTFGGVIRNSASNRFYPFTYTISAANTFEDKTVTLLGDTTGTWVTNNGTGLELIFGLGVGSGLSGTAGAWTSSFALSATGAVSVVGTSGATFYITGVQLEKGSTATSFDYRPYGTELALCQRYYERFGVGGQRTFLGSGGCDSTTTADVVVCFTKKRAIPTISLPSVASSFTISSAGVSLSSATSGASASFIAETSFLLALTGAAASLTTGRYALGSVRNDTAASYFVGVSAEL